MNVFRKGSAGMLVLAAAIGISYHDTASRTWHVPSESPTICGAVDSAAAGDTVLVAPGTYCRERAKDDGNGNAVWIEMRDGVTLLSEAGPAQTVLVEAHPWFSNTTIYGHGIVGARVEGFTITSGVCGSGSSDQHYDSGVELDASDVTVANNVVSHLYWGVMVGGNSPHAGTPVVVGNQIEDCTSGIFLGDATPAVGPVLEDNEVRQCVHGIDVHNSNPYIVGNRVEQCTDTGIYFYGWSETLMESNVIINNAVNGVLADMSNPYAAPCLNCGWEKDRANDVYGNGRYDVAYYDASGLGLFEARDNYWGTSCPDAARFHGRVNWTPWVNREHTVICSDCGSCPDATQPTTWGAIKAMYK